MVVELRGVGCPGRQLPSLRLLLQLQLLLQLLLLLLPLGILIGAQRCGAHHPGPTGIPLVPFGVAGGACWVVDDAGTRVTRVKVSWVSVCALLCGVGVCVPRWDPCDGQRVICVWILAAACGGTPVHRGHCSSACETREGGAVRRERV